MLNRRYLRIKVMQALYAYHQWEDKDIVHFEKEMLNSTEKIYDLYLHMLVLFVEVRDVATGFIEGSKVNILVSGEDTQPNTKFINNRFIKQLAINRHILKEVSSRKISWKDSPVVAEKVFYMIKSTSNYYRYMNSLEDSYDMDRKFILYLFKDYIFEFEMLEEYFDKKSIYWGTDLGLVCSSVLKTISSFHANSGSDAPLLPLYKDEVEDKAFMIDLFHKCTGHGNENLALIVSKIQEKDFDRTAMMDILLIEMAITELLFFPTIPIKVTLNEYVEMAKYYSTPQSTRFVNGVLNSIAVDLTMQGRIQKTGIGLIEESFQNIEQ